MSEEHEWTEKCWFCCRDFTAGELDEYGHVKVCQSCVEAIYDICIEVEHKYYIQNKFSEKIMEG